MVAFLPIPVCGYGCLGLACCTLIPLSTFSILMYVNMFESDKACGPQLWWFGLVLLIMGIAHSLGGGGGRSFEM